jgi:sugar phosphate isomerase/epimerase
MPMLRLAAITDEFSPDLDVALDAMAAAGVAGVELRTLGGRNIVDLTDREVDRACAAVADRGMTIVSIASPLLKCVLPGAPEIDPRVLHDVFGSNYAFADQPRLTDRVFAIARKTRAPVIRVFSYWRTIDPRACGAQIVAALTSLADRARDQGVTIGLENEHACNVGTGQESGRLLASLDHPALGLIWDPANALILGETPYPNGYRDVPIARVVHVHAKDCRVVDHVPIWGPLGEMDVDWSGQLAALRRDGYSGWISLETHWSGPGGDKLEASIICARKLQRLVTANETAAPPDAEDLS